MPLERLRGEHGHPVMKTMMGWRAWRVGRGLAPMEAATVVVTATPTPWLFGFFESIFVVVAGGIGLGGRGECPEVTSATILVTHITFTMKHEES